MITPKISKQSLPAIVGITFSVILILAQLSGNWGNLTMSSREVSLVFISQVEELFPSGKRIKLWLESRSILSKKILEYELRVRELEATNARLSYLEQENKDLKESFTGGSRGEWLGASLLRGGGKYLVDVGSSNGVKPLAVVLVRGSFLGVVKDVYQDTSLIDSIFDNEARLAVRAGGESALGVMRSKAGTLILTTISRAEAVKIGDMVTTLGDEQVKQAGLLVGYVEENLTRPSDPVSTFKVRPAIEITKISGVVVSMESR